MRICQVGTGFTSIPPQISAATEEVIYYMSRELLSLSCDVTVIDVMDKRRQRSNLVILEQPYLSFIKSTKSNSVGLIAKRLSFSLFSNLWLNSFKKNFDIIHFHNQFPASMFQFLCNWPPKNIPSTVYTVHNPIWGLPESEIPKNVRLKYVLEVESIKRSSKVIAVSEMLKRNIVSRLSLKSSSVVTIPNGVDTNFFHPNKFSPTLRKKLASKGEQVILCVGRISRFKGQKLLVESIPEIISEFSNVKFVFVGPRDDTEYMRKIDAMVESKSLKKYCVFTGTVSSEMLPEYFATADIFVLPSITEGMPLTLLQAMSSGKAIVASAIPQNAEVASFRNDSICLSELNPKSMSNAIIDLLRDEEKRTRLGETARKSAEANFDWKIIARKTLHLYEELLEQK